MILITIQKVNKFREPWRLMTVNPIKQVTEQICQDFCSYSKIRMYYVILCLIWYINKVIQWICQEFCSYSDKFNKESFIFWDGLGKHSSQNWSWTERLDKVVCDDISLHLKLNGQGRCTSKQFLWDIDKQRVMDDKLCPTFQKSNAND